MNANWSPALSVVAGATLLTLCLVTSGPAAPSAAAGNRAAGRAERLTRSEVDQLLQQATEAIGAGNLDRAEALVARTERAQVRYPLFHFGATPSSVRRELQQAKQSATRSGGATISDAPRNVVPASASAVDLASAPPSDPFLERPAGLPAAPSTQPAPPNQSDDEMRSVIPALHQHEVGTPQERAQLASAQDEPPAGRDVAPLPPELSYSTIADDDTPRLLPAGESPSRSATGSRPMESSSAEPEDDPKSRVLSLIRQARQALVAGKLTRAEELAREASSISVPESAFLPHEDRPSMLMWDLHRARANQQSAAQPGDRSQPTAAGPSIASDRYAAQTTHSSSDDQASENVDTARTSDAPLRFAQLPEPLDLPQGEDAISEEGLPTPQPLAPSMPTPMAQNRAAAADEGSANEAAELLEAGEAALRDRDHQSAAVLFGQVYLIRDQLEPAQRRRLQKHMQMLSSADDERGDADSQRSPSTLIDSAEDGQQALARRMSAEVGNTQTEARRLRETSPEQAAELLQETRQQVADSELAAEYRDQLLRRLDISLDETEQYARDHAAEIELDQQNQSVRDEVNRHREVKVKVQQKVAELVDEFNKLRDEQRYSEMEVVARRLIELAPEEEVAQQVWQNAKFIRREILNRQVADAKEESFWNALYDVETSSVQEVGDDHEMVYDQEKWRELISSRKGAAEQQGRRTPGELEIERRLKTPVLLRYENTPLSEVVHGLSELAGVNIHLDPRGLSQEGINSDTPVTIDLSKEISLKSALNLILEPLHLSYVIKDEVLKITSEQLRNGEISPQVYNVADLVIPIPNFVPNSNIGLQGLINSAHAAMGNGSNVLGMPGPTVLVNDPGPRGQMGQAGGDVLAQQFGGSPAGGSSMPIGSGPGGMGGGANADFDSLIDLIVSTIATETWAENGGGEAEIRPFPTNLSLVVSQTQAVHEEIADLLEQLRRLQDLQVTIEVRFIQLNDSFFERIGIDFDMNIEDRAAAGNIVPGQPLEPGQQSAVVGLQPAAPPDAPFPNFTSDLDIPFRQDSFGLTTPVFGGVPTNLPSFGFAILSDIEAYFLIEAAQGDRRTNVLNAPKVTLFNGQQAFVADAVSRPFVMGVIPVVGEFAAAQQPVIVVLNEGTLMTIQAVVSDDRRYVRLTVVPFFTEVGNVQEFTFEGSSSSVNSSSSSTTEDDDSSSEDSSDMEETQRSGVTVQLPSFQFIAVVTTVSVPDGGTVLLGGIKRLSEGRNEAGIPLLSKVPYVNRLFRNVGIGRETDSLMMMVTPRIIIQEEEEERLGIAVP